MHGVCLIEFQHGDVGLKLAGEGHLAQQGGGHTAHEVGAGAVGEDLQALRFEQLNGHLRGGGLTVRAGDDDHAVGQLRELFGYELRVQFFHNEAGERGAATAKLSRVAHALTQKANEGFGHAYHFSTRTPTAEWSAGTRSLTPEGAGVGVARTASPAPAPA